jgi:hypothetical protein
MIGFKTIDDYTFDECIAFLNEHETTDPSWIEVNSRYQHLLTNLQKNDDSAFSACASSEDYKNYIAKFSSINGASKYQPRHIEEASAFLDEIQHADTLRSQTLSVKLGKFRKYNNILTFVILFFLLLFSVCGITSGIVYFFIGELGSHDSIGCFACFLGSVSTIVSIWKILCMKKYGVTMLIIASIISCIPLVFIAYLCFVVFSLCSTSLTILLWGTLHIKKHGISAWECYDDEPQWLTYLRTTIFTIWLFFVSLFPPIVALCLGCNSDIYKSGAFCIDNYLYSEASESYDSSDEIGEDVEVIEVVEEVTDENESIEMASTSGYDDDYGPAEAIAE